MFEITRDTLAALLAIAAKDDPREWMNAVYFYADGVNAYAFATTGNFCARQTLGPAYSVRDAFGVPVLTLETVIFASKKSRDRDILISEKSVECGEIELLFKPKTWSTDRTFDGLIAPSPNALLGPNSGNYNPHSVAKIADLIGASDVRQKWHPVQIRTDFKTLSGYVDTGKTKACIMGVRV